jgi:hypothetical protein
MPAQLRKFWFLVILDFCVLWDRWNGDVACNHPLREWLTPAAGWL